ncbi:hypothetical protein ALP29_04765, partial [Pseudomonas syringae pv. avii]
MQNAPLLLQRGFSACPPPWTGHQRYDHSMNLIQRIDALLPQTQCGKCGHPGCKPYAEGIAKGEAINKCPPGGQETIAGLAQLLRLP